MGVHALVLFCALLSAPNAFASVTSTELALGKERVFEQKLEVPASSLAVTFRTGSQVSVQVKEEDGWSAWHTLTLDNDASPWEKHTGLLYTENATAVRLRSEVDMELTLHAMSVSRDPISYQTAAARTLAASVIIPRWQWGADESLRISKRGPSDVQRMFESSDPFLADSIRNCERRATLYPDEFREVNRTFTDEEGRSLAWPQGYSPEVHMFVVHHTAESSTESAKRSGVERMRTIYAYHTVSRGWGDIGYNFVIDPDGNIYEGRAGGDFVVGAHAYCNNVGTIGISLMGNFQTGRPPDAQLAGLRLLLMHLSEKYGIDPATKILHHGKLISTIVGHRDVRSTACPGEHSEELLPQLRLATAEGNFTAPLFSSVASASSQNEAALMASMDPLTLGMGEEKDVEVRFMNVGLDTWNEHTWLLGETDRGAYFTEIKPYSFIAAKMREGSVTPGEIATFSVHVQGGLKEARGEIRFTPVINNDRRLIANTARMPFSVRPTSPRFTHVTSSFPPLHKTGEDLTGTIKILNSGEVPWVKDTITEIVFGMEGDKRGDVSVISQPAIVRPDEQGSFRVRFHNVDEEGQYTRSIKPRFADDSPLIGASILVASRAEPIPDIMQHASTPIRLLAQARSAAPEGSVSSYNDVIIEAIAGKEFTLSPREQMAVKIRIRAGSRGLARSQRIAPVVRSSDTLTILDERNLRVEDMLQAPASLLRFQTFDTSLTLVAPRLEGEYTFSIGEIDYHLTVKPSGRYAVQTAPPRRLTRRTATRNERSERRLERRERYKRNAPPPLTEVKDDRLIRIRLGFAGGTTILSSPATLRIEGDGNIIFTDSPAHLGKTLGMCNIATADGEFKAKIIRIMGTNQHASTMIHSWARSANRFHGVLECRILDDKLTLINELPLEDYLAGLAEEPDSEPFEKQRAFAIAARSYALFYLDAAQRKFPGKPYDGSDSPQEFQAYGGAFFEELNPRWVESVRDTKGKVLMWERKVIKAPYHSSNNGNTRSALEVWGWEHTPYLDSVHDPYCEGMSNWGHGVGMSGCGAKGYANAGLSAEEILAHYYPGTKVMKWEP